MALSRAPRAPRTPVTPARSRGAIGRLIVAALCLLALVGCRARDERPVAQWTLVADGIAASQITLPTHVDRRLAPTPQTYRLRARIDVPLGERGVDHVLVIPHLWARVALRIAGRSIDPPLDPVVTGRLGVHAFRISADDMRTDRLEIELEVRHDWTQSGWLDTVPYLTTSPDGGPMRRVQQALVGYGNVTAASAALTIGFAYGVLFLFGRRTPAHGWFALQGVSAAIHCLLDAGVAYYLFGRFTVAVSLVSLVVGIYASVHFTRDQFALAPPSRVWGGLVVVALVVAIALPGPFQTSRYLPIVACTTLAAGASNQLWVVGRLAVRKDPPTNAYVVLAAWVMLATFATGDCVAWLGLGEVLGGPRTSSIGITAFALLQSVALTRDFLGALAESDRLNAALRQQVTQLAREQATVGSLNDELRRQVLARTEALSDALTRLASAQGEQVVFHEGDLIEDRYRVVRALGAGGMGVVYEVRRVPDDARLALKVLSGAPGVRELARFAREAKLIAELHHPNVVKVHDAAVAKRGFLFIVLEYVDGPPLNRLRDRFGDVDWALGVLHGIAEGLAAVHERGIVHRDLKPGNVLVPREAAAGVGAVKLVDFGISNASSTSSSSDSGDRARRDPNAPSSDEIVTAELTPGARAADAPTLERPALQRPADAPAPPPRADVAHLTQTGQFLGTPVYMAPEVIRDPRAPITASDVYSFGVVAFELMFARRPFTEVEAFARAHGIGAALAVPSFAHLGLGETLRALLDGALDADPLRRPTAAELARAIELEIESRSRAVAVTPADA